MKVFIGPHEIAGYYTNLAKGFRSIGVDCDFITYNPHSFDYGGESASPLLLRFSRFCIEYQYRIKYSPSRIRSLLSFLGKIGGKLSRFIWALLAIFKYDVFIFGFGHSLLSRNLDLYILRFLGKRVISFIAHGSESRPPYIDGFYQSKNGKIQPSLDRLIKLTLQNSSKTKRIERLSNVIVGAPFATSHFLRGKCVNFFALGLPLDEKSHAKEHNRGPNSRERKEIRILHCPSHPAAKGTTIVEEAIRNLTQRGYKINFLLIHGKPHADVIHEIKRCDFVVDQVYCDTPMAGFATEAAWFGKPAVVGGYGFDYLKTYVPEGMWPPSKTCHPDKIENAIESLIVNKVERQKLGEQAHKFVHERWNAIKVAKKFLRLIQDDIPHEWWLDSNDICYLAGIGQPIDRTKENIRKMVEQYGVESLQLSHRPDLEQAFLDFACLNQDH